MTPPSMSPPLLRIFNTYVRPHRALMATAFVFMACAAAASGGSAWVIKPAIQDVFIRHLPGADAKLAVFMVGISLLRGGALYVQNISIQKLAHRSAAAIQRDMFAALLRSDVTAPGESHSGTVAASFHDVRPVRDAVANLMAGVVRDTLGIIALAGVMFYQNAALAGPALFVLLPMALGVKRLSKRTRKAARNMMAADDALAGAVGDVLAGIRTVRVYGGEGRESARAERIVLLRMREAIRAAASRALSAPLTETLTGLGFAAVILYAGYRQRSGDAIDFGSFMSFIAAMMLAYQPGRNLSALSGNIQEASAAATRIFTLIDRPPATSVAAAPVSPRFDRVSLAFDDVSFAYGAHTVLDRVSFTVPAGQSAVLLGPSGAGKSTLLNLIPRFADVTSGRITLNGIDLRDFDPAVLRQHMAFVGQEPFLFDDTVRENIRYAAPAADDAHIRAALEAAGALDFVSALPQGLDTPVGEGGRRFSGGQRQRLAIARAFLRDAPLLLLDEPTSALDEAGERRILDALDRLRHGRTVLTVTHRPAPAAGADVRLMFAAGHVSVA